METLNIPRIKLRAYVFVNVALSSIQKGIQAAHVMLDMATRYHNWKGNPDIGKMYWEWATMDKTLIVCHGGFNAGIKNWQDFIHHNHHTYPREYFREDFETLGGLTTAVGIILPDTIYDASSAYRKGELTEENLIVQFPSVFNQELIVRLSRESLAV